MRFSFRDIRDSFMGAGESPPVPRSAAARAQATNHVNSDSDDQDDLIAAYEELRETNDSLGKKYRSLKAAYHDLKEENKQDRSQIGKLQLQLEIHNERDLNLRNQHQRLLHEKRGLESEYEKLNLKSTSTERELWNTIAGLQTTATQRTKEIVETKHRHATDIQKYKNLEGQQARTLSDNAQLRQNLEECKDRIFKMQPPHMITDAEVAEAYQALCTHLEDWVASAIAQVPEGFLYESQSVYLTDHKTCKLVDDLEGGRPPGMEISIISTLFFDIFYECCLYPNHVWPGVSTETESLVKSVMAGLRNIKPAAGMQPVRPNERVTYRFQTQPRSRCGV
jgi:hypothetical protein